MGERVNSVTFAFVQARIWRCPCKIEKADKGQILSEHRLAEITLERWLTELKLKNFRLSRQQLPNNSKQGRNRREQPKEDA